MVAAIREEFLGSTRSQRLPEFRMVSYLSGLYSDSFPGHCCKSEDYLSLRQQAYTLLDAATGNLVWRFDTELPLGNSPSVFDGVVYVGGYDRKLYALNVATGAKTMVLRQR